MTQRARRSRSGRVFYFRGHEGRRASIEGCTEASAALLVALLEQESLSEPSTSDDVPIGPFSGGDQ